MRQLAAVDQAMLSADVLNTFNVRIDLFSYISILNLALKGNNLKNGVHQENRRRVVRVARLIYLLDYFQVLIHHLHHGNIIVSSREKF
jgi:hypothetical protein